MQGRHHPVHLTRAEPVDPGHGTVLVVGLSGASAARVSAVCAEQQLDVETSSSTDDNRPTGSPPAAVVVGIADEAAARAVREYRQRWPEAPILCILDTPDPIVWRLAQRTSDVVVNKGAAARVLRDLLAARGSGQQRRFALCDVADAAGRLGFVTEVPDSPVGPVALFRVGGELSVISTVCPHSGADLSQGALEGAVLTCPRHGSQFDVRSGERVRGPADDPVTCWRVIEASGQLWMILS